MLMTASAAKKPTPGVVITRLRAVSVADNLKNFTIQAIQTVAQLPPGGKQDVDELLQITHLLNVSVYPRLEFRRTDIPTLSPIRSMRKLPPLRPSKDPQDD